jgi:hypothetical protein
MFLEGGTRDHFMRWLGQEYPEMVEGYTRLYARKYAPSAYRKEVQRVVALLRRKYDVGGCDEDNDANEPPAIRFPEQQMLDWTVIP